MVHVPASRQSYGPVCEVIEHPLSSPILLRSARLFVKIVPVDEQFVQGKRNFSVKDASNRVWPDSIRWCRESCSGRARRWIQRILPLVVGFCAISLVGCGDGPAGEDSRAEPADRVKVTSGRTVYKQHCARCHGAELEGQPDWWRRLPSGRFPAPPHDDSGHTWHHPDQVLFVITKNGLVPPHAPQGYESDMPAFGSTLSDEEIWAVLAYIKSHWTTAIQPIRAEMLRGTATK